ncbi:dsDNA nuclease domain-containing protein [Paraburkholderia sediminicola]|uniref:dsDNA nuclease domain-containing protein n=1 Tax=Paraburkholderia sediminicola TaxID=458836 RepID=UPI0038BC2BB9
MREPKPRRSGTAAAPSRTTASNPLYAPQREKAGAATFDRFNFQYDWALYEFLERHKHNQASIVFVEFHEDVVFSSSLDADEARFVFCQVKTGASANFNKKSLVKRIKQKPSVLGKMFTSIGSKEIDARVDKVRLVATGGFKLELAEKGFSLEEIPWDALTPETASEIGEALAAELGADCALEKLHFHKPQLGELQHRRTVIGLIADLISERVPDEGGNCQALYLVLQDELRRKGVVTWDYSDWESLVRDKGLTGQRVEALFEQFASSATVDELLSDFDYATAQLQYESRERRKIRQSARTYVLNTLDGGSLSHLQVRASISKHLSAGFPLRLTSELLTELVAACPAVAREHLVDESSLAAAYIIEYLRA